MPETHEQRAARLRRWRHYSFLGGVEMARQNMRAIEIAPSTTAEARQLASEIARQLVELRALLRKRID